MHAASASGRAHAHARAAPTISLATPTSSITATCSWVSGAICSSAAKLCPSAAAGLDLVFLFNITDAENYYLVVKDGTCDLQQGDSSDANVTLIMDSETMQGIVSGETDGMQAFMAGKLRAEGDMMLAMKLSELFPA